jgi:hypothetical protein
MVRMIGVNIRIEMFAERGRRLHVRKPQRVAIARSNWPGENLLRLLLPQEEGLNSNRAFDVSSECLKLADNLGDAFRSFSVPQRYRVIRSLLPA